MLVGRASVLDVPTSRNFWRGKKEKLEKKENN